MPGGIGSLVGVGLPGLVILVLVLLPWLDRDGLRRFSKNPQGLIATSILMVIAMWVATMTTTSYLSDYRDQRIRWQLAKQSALEQAFRSAPFTPESFQTKTETTSSSTRPAPTAYVQYCSNCHGPHGEGGSQGALKFPALTNVAAKPRRTVDDIVGLLNDPTAYDIQPPMRSFATKLTEQEKREIAEWVVNLK